jgi:hypothetical protein
MEVNVMSVKEGYNASLSLGGTVVANLSEVSYEETRAYKEWVPMGSIQPSQVLLGALKYKVTAKHGWVDNTYLNYMSGGSILAGTVLPRGGTTPVISGSCVVVGSKLSNMKQESADPVLDDITIVMYNVTHA